MTHRSILYRLKKHFKSSPPLPQSSVEAFFKKYTDFETVKNTTETIILGSSHGLYGYTAQEREFNYADTSQDLYYSFSLYEKAAALPKMKNLILFYSVFSPGSMLVKTNDKNRCLPYKVLLDIPYQFDDSELSACGKAMKKQIKQIKNGKLPAFPRFGNCDYSFFFSPETNVAERVAAHMKNNGRNNGQTSYVQKMAALAKESRHNFYVVIPPHRSDYKSFLPRNVYKEIIALTETEKSICLLNFFDDGDFNDDDFGDMDHLNAKGAEKLTAKIRKSLVLNQAES